jgi:galactokinase
MGLKQRTITAFRQRYGVGPDFIARAPGRVNLLGEHVDYNEGFVMPVAIDRDTMIAFRKSGSQTSSVYALDLGEETEFDHLSILQKKAINGSPLASWAYYPAGVMWSLAAEGLETPGIQAVFASEVPRGAGLSSSASVELAFGVAWKTLGEWNIPPLQLAQLALKAEIHYVGLNCGIMDQFASACGLRDHLLYLDCRSLAWKTVTMPEETVIVVADTSVRRSLTDSAYNERHASCEEAVRILQEFLPGIKALRDVNVEQFKQFENRLPNTTAKRARHIIEEIARTGQALELLEQKDLIHFGKLMNACHTSLRDLYDVSCPELDVMVSLAQSLPGCFGARLTGAGFGGCTVNLVDKESGKDFSHSLATGFTQKTGLLPDIYICQTANGAGAEPV